MIFNCEPIFQVIHIKNSCVYQKTVPAIYVKKRLSAQWVKTVCTLERTPCDIFELLVNLHS